MEKLKRSLSFRKKKDHVPECSKPHQWQEDERKVRDGTCSFQVRYLGCIEVFESRGMQVCEEAVRALKAQCKGKYQRAILYVSGDALRVVDEISKGLIVDQTIEKVSFCAPDRNHEKGFAYICRDGTTRRWMCHGFLALKESGERLSHAVGCAFAICLEKKQKREKDAVQVQYNDKGTSFTRTGSFRQATITERLADPQIAMVPERVSQSGTCNGGVQNPFSTPNKEPVPMKKADNPNAVPRPHATDAMLQRQGSFRGFEKLQDSSPFKRQLSLRLNDLPSTLERHRDMSLNNPSFNANGPGSVSPIAEASPTKERGETISQLCQEVTQGLTALSSDDPFANAPCSGVAAAAAQMNHHPANANVGGSGAAMPMNHPSQSPQHGPVYTATVQGRNVPLAAPIRQNNPWASPPPTGAGGKVSDAEFWLNATASQLVQQTPPSSAGPFPQHHPDPYMKPGMVNGSSAAMQHQQSMFSPPAGQVAFNPAVRAPHLSHLRSHSIDTADMTWQGSSARAPTLSELSQRGPITQFQSQQNGVVSNNAGATWSSSAPSAPPQPPGGPDPFDAAWAAKSSNKNNPFQSGDNVTKAFEVKL